MKRINSAALIISKILEVVHWVMVGLMLCLLVTSLVAGQWLAPYLLRGVPLFGTELATYGFTLSAVGLDGSIDMAAIRLFCLGAVLILSLMAMVFRNVFLILKTTKGMTWFSKGDTPFQNDNTRMVREIGIFYMAVPVIGLVMSVIARLVVGDAAEVSMNLEGLITGMILLCLSQVFSYGTQLQQDVDGLV